MKPGNSPAKAPSDRALAAAHSRWVARAARPLPSRTPPRDPNPSLVSEFMLQQTQVSRVLEKFEPFLVRFPTPAALAAAPERSVLAAWSGLGYYRRARLLHAAAKAVTARHDGSIPADLDSLEALPGIGRYTAGALASIVFKQPAPIVDGNVARVLMRLRGKPLAHASPQALRWSWAQAAALITQARRPDLFNEGLMELGATICTPRNPACDRCPLRTRCLARARAQQDSIPLSKRPARRRTLHCTSILIPDRRGRYLVEPRPATGLWAYMWQAPTLESPETAPPAATLHDWLGLRTLIPTRSFRHATTHRDVTFHVWTSPALPAAAAARLKSRRPAARWLTPTQIAALPLSNPQRSILLAPLP